ncbi:hypothetical protein LH705_20885 [Pseudomonas putida]|uniref:hypothetical protein n=1 Tax=Pseudomonas putida TaxID=303 RepID=UPI001F207C52|nr:hypothetical protein [Pseudomonas putida]MCF1251980.1 hypothetical protein [Pseudomonas putida]
MTRLALCLLLLATGASADPLPRYVERIHDSERAVTCWIASAGMGIGISCIPDSQLNLPTSSESQKSRASAPTSMWKNEQLPTTPTPALAPGRWIDERYQL